MVLSTTAAGTMSQTARGLSSFFTKSTSEVDPTALSCTSSCTVFGDMSKTTHGWPPLMSRRTMFAPIRPSPIIPSCIGDPFQDRVFDPQRSGHGFTRRDPSRRRPRTPGTAGPSR